MEQLEAGLSRDNSLFTLDAHGGGGGPRSGARDNPLGDSSLNFYAAGNVGVKHGENSWVIEAGGAVGGCLRAEQGGGVAQQEQPCVEPKAFEITKLGSSSRGPSNLSGSDGFSGGGGSGGRRRSGRLNAGMLSDTGEALVGSAFVGSGLSFEQDWTAGSLNWNTPLDSGGGGANSQSGTNHTWGSGL